jgi:D-alanyl-D-alanine carboxypeptidase
VYLSEGEKITVKDLLYGLMLESGNDAACALAIACSGSVEKFVSDMNEKARRLGLLRTSFANPHGLPAENHYTTAGELSKIAFVAMQNPLFREIVRTREYISKGENGENAKYFRNHNRLLHSYKGATGIKTGYTLSSGRCLVTSAERNGTSFIAVTLDDRHDFADHGAMLDFAFDNFTSLRFAKKGEINGIFNGVRMENTDGITLVQYKKDGKSTLDTEITLGICSDFNNN